MSEEIDLELQVVEAFHFFVPGIPAPGGSKRFVGIGRKTGRAIIIDAGGEKTKNWRTSVAQIGAEVMAKLNLTAFTRPLQANFEFFMPRPKGHFHQTGKRVGQLKNTAPKFPAVKPDTTKLIRSTEDALKGITWLDDSLIVRQFGAKDYGEMTGCKITISEL